jgi:chromosome segregation ATPase
MGEVLKMRYRIYQFQGENQRAAARIAALEAEKVELEASRADALHELSGLELKIGLAESSSIGAQASLKELQAKHAHIQDLHAQASDQVRTAAFSAVHGVYLQSRFHIPGSK